MTLLTPTQASELVGVPAVQLCRWAYLGQGPRNSGTKHKPMFDEDDLKAWREMLNRPRRFRDLDHDALENEGLKRAGYQRLNDPDA